MINKIKDNLKLRRLETIQVKLKNNKEIDKLVIGFIWPKSRNYKVNYLTTLPKRELSESDFSLYVEDKIKYLKNEIEKDIDQAKIIIESLPSKADRDDFQNRINSVLSDFSGSITKSERIKEFIKKIESKINKKKYVKKEEEKLQTILDQIQITDYHNYFSEARKHKRKLKLYIGPTNSGKTYLALNDLASHRSGVYLSPLRLLAFEGMEELEKRGQKTSLITGEERQEKAGARFKSQTIETLNFFEENDCVLIDEIQMLADSQRGWAWSAALIGASCKELIMAGSPEAEPLVQKIADILGEELEIIRLERFNPLEVATQSYRFPQDLHKLPEGSAIIAFSRKNILAYKEMLAQHGVRASVVYGSLSPDVRVAEALRFRSGETKYIIATDAIALGMNLPISTIIFSSTEKFNGTEVKKLTAMEVKQISGRAGRFGKVEKGIVSSFDGKDLNYIRSVINNPGKMNKFFYIKPSLEHVLTISAELNTDKLFPVLTFFTKKVMSRRQGDELYVCSDMDESKELALLLDRIPGLSIEDKFLFSNSPVPGDEHYSIFAKWIRSYQKDEIMPPPKISDLKLSDFKYDDQFRLENYVKLLTLYSWLSYKKPNNFLDQKLCMKIRNEANSRIEKLLSGK